MDFRHDNLSQQQGSFRMCPGSNPLPPVPAQVNPSSMPFDELGCRSQSEFDGQLTRSNGQGGTHHQSSIGGLDQRCFHQLDNGNFMTGRFENAHAGLDRAAAIGPVTADGADGANPAEPTPGCSKSGSSARSIRSVHWDDDTEDEMSDEDEDEDSSFVASSPRRWRTIANPDPYCQVDDYGSPRERRRRTPILHSSPSQSYSPSATQAQQRVLRGAIALTGYRGPISAPKFAPPHGRNVATSEVVRAVAVVRPEDQSPVPNLALSHGDISSGGAFNVVIRSIGQPRQDAGLAGRAQVKRTRDDFEGTATMAARDIARENEIRVGKTVASFDLLEEEASEITPLIPKSCRHRHKSRRTGGSGRVEEMNVTEAEEVDEGVENLVDKVMNEHEDMSIDEQAAQGA